jgi:hypothetical protein
MIGNLLVKLVMVLLTDILSPQILSQFLIVHCEGGLVTGSSWPVPIPYLAFGRIAATVAKD